MSQFLSFAEILEQKIRKEIHTEIESEIRSQHTVKTEQQKSSKPMVATDLWLTGLVAQVKTLSLDPSAKAQNYHKLRTPPPPPKPHKLSAEQDKAMSFFATHDIALTAAFSKSELKRAYRRLALKLHPDRGGDTARFVALRKAFETLSLVFRA